MPKLLTQKSTTFKFSLWLNVIFHVKYFKSFVSRSH